MQDTHDEGWRRRERRYADAGSMQGQRSTLFASAFALTLFVFVMALSARQSTSSGTARGVLENGIASITEVDLVLAERGAEIRQLGTTSPSPTFEVPGYPLPVQLSTAEASSLSTPALRQLILSRSAAIVYTDGLAAFDRTGHQSLGLLSAEGALRLATGQLSEASHTRATVATIVLALVLALFAALVLTTAEGYGRLRALGVALLLGAVPGVAVFAALRLLVSLLGGDDAFVSDLRGVLTALIDVVLRNFAILAGLGLVFVLSPIGLRFAEQRLARAAPDRAGDDDRGYLGPDDDEVVD